MGRAKVIVGVLGAGVGALAIAGGGGWMWASGARDAALTATFETHRVDFPIPFPLGEQEIAQLRSERAALADPAAPPADPAAPPTDPAAPPADPVDPLEGVDLGAIALERAIERGKHLVEARYACVECHGKDFGGGTMVDDPAMGKLLGPNLTLGVGSRTKDYAASDWDRAVRHGVLPDGKGSVMPAEDYRRLSDRELSDIVSFIRSHPPVDREMAKSSFGPIGTMLVATGKLTLAATETDHQAGHPTDPPSEADPSFGRHLLQVCTGCHREEFNGGPIAKGPPDWPAAGNLTPTGLEGWTYDDFVRALREGKRKDGTELKPPMSLMTSYAANMTEAELRAMWEHLQSLPPMPTGT